MKLATGGAWTHKDLLVFIILVNRPRKLQKSVTQRALAVIDVGDDAKVAEPL